MATKAVETSNSNSADMETGDLETMTASFENTQEIVGDEVVADT